MSERNFRGDTDFDETLRLLARAEVPEGLAERVKARLKEGEVIQWPEKPSVAAMWMKRAAAAAIVFVVGGGSWFVYTGVNSAAAGSGQKPVVIESQKPGEFGNAGAMRKVDPLTAPVVQKQGTGISHPSKQITLAGDPYREQGSVTPTSKDQRKLVAPEKTGKTDKK